MSSYKAPLNDIRFALFDVIGADAQFARGVEQRLLLVALEDMAYAHLRLKNYDSVIYYQQKHLQNLNMPVLQKTRYHSM